MVDELVRRGWKRENIYLVDDDEGVSGTKRIDERVGMTYLFELIAERKIGVVACQDEDRLFRDMTQIQVNIFIDACRRSNVKVLTPFMTYNFAHPLQGEYHARQFRFKCDMAAEFIKTYILGRLTPARLRILKEGKWGGSKIPVGFMVDLRKKLSDGVENPHYRHFVPFEPYAKIVREYFRVFLENGGSVRRALQQIYQQRISFPDCKPPDGFKVRYQLKWREHGYYLARGCMVGLLTNPAYIGHWCVKGVIEHWDHHQPIVDLDTFMKAFNHLSKYTLTGEDNLDYQPYFAHARPDLEAKRGVERPLLSGLFYSQVNGSWYRASSSFDKKTNCYLYLLNRVEIDGTHLEWARRAAWCDLAVVARFKAKLAAMFDVDTWTQALREAEEGIQRERKIKRLTLTALESEKLNLVTSLGKLNDALLIEEVEKRFKRVVQERERLLVELAALDQQQHKYLSVEQTYALFEQTLSNWESMTPNEQRNVLAMFIERIVASEYSRSGTMLLTVQWKDGTSDEIQLERKPSSLNNWRMDEINHLMALVDSNASQLDIAATFPKRQWQQIWIQIKRRRGIIKYSPVYLGKEQTYEDYVAKGGRKPKATSLPWREDELQLLKEMAERRARQLDIMKAFPERRWKFLREKIKILTGQLPVATDGVRQTFTYTEYAQQTKTSESDASSH